MISLDKVILGMYGYIILENKKTLLEFMCTKAIHRLFSFHLADLRIFEHNQNHSQKNCKQ